MTDALMNEHPHSSGQERSSEETSSWSARSIEVWGKSFRALTRDASGFRAPATTEPPHPSTYRDKPRQTATKEGAELSRLCFVAVEFLRSMRLVFENDRRTSKELLIRQEEALRLSTWPQSVCS